MPSPFPSNTVAVLITLICAAAKSGTTVTSSVVFPSPSFPSSLLSVTSSVP